jgi:hypothetical protein
MSHLVYQNNLTTKLKIWQRRKSRALKTEWLEAAHLLLRLDLDCLSEDLKKLYSDSPRGRPPYLPISMLRALLLMSILRFVSIEKFVRELRSQPRLAFMAGFHPTKTPSVGAFYLFIDRLEDGHFEKSCSHRIKPSRVRKRSLLRNLKKEKAEKQQLRNKILSQSDSITNNLKNQLLNAAHQPRPADYLQRLEDLLIKSAVIPSAARGLLGDLNKLIIVGDGAALPTGVSWQGVATCDCSKQGIYSCDHDRLYRDHTANWGYDSYRECFYFGHCYYQHCVSSQGHDLPIQIMVAPASESDFTHSLKSLDRMIKAFSQHNLPINIYAAAYDSGHDSLGNYQFLIDKQIHPVISLNERKSQAVKPTGSAQQVNQQGVPICIGGLPMRRQGVTKHKTIAYCCPVKRPSHEDGKYLMKSYPQQCPLKVLCQPDTKMGPVVTVSPKDDPRHYPVIERGSDRYNQIMNLRSGCERSNSMKKVVHRLDQRPCRSSTHYLFRLYLISIVEHAKAWLAQDKKLFGDDSLLLIEHLVNQDKIAVGINLP